MKFSEAKSAIRLLIFDLDGTLIDSKTDLVLSVNATLRSMGRPSLDDETVSSYVGQGSPALIARALGEGFTEAEIRRGLEFFLGYYWEHKLDNTRLYPGVREALGRLTNGGGDDGRVLAVLTNKPERVSRDILQELDLLRFFRCVYGGNSFESKKPDPLGIHFILQETDLPPRAALIVGDSDVDIQAGRNAGVWTCGVTYGFGNLEMDSNPPHLVVHSLPELAEILNPTIFPNGQNDKILAF
ncbi:MAG: HAD-IA family hydrolase [Acidobacteria bacterium]|nr:HAD-IA family hydrolase [Acidobacteriota bacterium]